MARNLFDRLIWDRRKAARARLAKGFSQPPFWAAEPAEADGDLPYDFEGRINAAYRANGIVFACSLTRLLLFTEARFQWREMRQGRPGNLFGSPELARLEVPWPNGTTGDLLGLAETWATVAGNFYATWADDRGRLGRAALGGPGERIAVLRPHWTEHVITSRSENPLAADARTVGYRYAWPAAEGKPSGEVLLTTDEVAHWMPVPDPLAPWRGMSWLTPILREVEADKAATRHKLWFLRNFGMIPLVIALDKEVGPEDFSAFVDDFEARHAGPTTSGRPLFLGGGADVTPALFSWRDLDLKNVQGNLETRIAAAARTPPAIVGLSEGLAGSSLNEGNFKAARRLLADGYARPSWRGFASAIGVLVAKPRTSGDVVNLGANLWYDDRDIAFLHDDARDRAEVQQLQMSAIASGVTAGFVPDAVVDAVVSGDLSRMVGAHSGLFSVQLQPAGTARTPEPTRNGNGVAPADAIAELQRSGAR